MLADIVRVFSSNFIKMFISIITTFILPKVLTVSCYGFIKLYQFYNSYDAISHFGFLDGILLEYGENEVEKEKVSQEHSTLIANQIIFAFVVFIIAIFMKDIVMVFWSLSILPLIVTEFYTNIFRAQGKFKLYARILNYTSFMELIAYIMLLFVFKSTNYIYYIGLLCVVKYIVLIIAVFTFKSNYDLVISKPSFGIFKKFVKVGFTLLIGYFAYAIFIGIDKWFIKYRLGIDEFAAYSFVGQFLSIINIVITPIATTMFSYFCRRKNYEFEYKIKNIIVILVLAILPVVYPVKFVVIRFLPNYAGSLSTLEVLFLVQSLISINTIVYINLFKTYRRQKEYIRNLFISIALAIFLDLICCVANLSIIFYAISTLISMILWTFMNMLSFKYLRLELKTYIYFLVIVSSYVALNMLKNTIAAFVIYVFIFTIFTFIVMNKWVLLLLKKLHIKRN